MTRWTTHFLFSAGAVLIASCATARQSEHALIVHLKLSDARFGASGESFALYDVEDALRGAVGEAGEVDGHEVGGGWFVIFIYGANAQVLADRALPLLRGKSPAGSYVEIRPGGPKVAAQRIALD